MIPKIAGPPRRRGARIGNTKTRREINTSVFAKSPRNRREGLSWASNEACFLFMRTEVLRRGWPAFPRTQMRRNPLSIYTPAPPDHHAVLEAVAHFRKLNPQGMPAYADVHAWSRTWTEGPDSDPRFLEADITALADAIILALERGRQKAPTKDWRHRKPRDGRPTPPARPAVASVNLTESTESF